MSDDREIARRNLDYQARGREYAPEGLGSAAVLADEGGRMTMPLNKIIRYLEEGPENNTLFYAEGELKNRK